MAESKLSKQDEAPDFVFDTPWKAGQQYYKEAGDNTSVLIFLRYIGCPVCQMEMARIKQDIDRFNSKNAGVFVILQSRPEIAAKLARKNDWPFTIVCDPEAEIFLKYGVTHGGLLKYLHPAGLMAVVKATFKGFRHGKFEGRETQTPAVFIADADRRITYAYYGKNISDVPSTETILANL